MATPDATSEVINKTLLYDGLAGLPDLVRQAVDLAKAQGFSHSCTPEQGRLLQLLAYGRNGGHIGETGTGFGVGLAWMVTSTDATTGLVSIERNEQQAELCRQLFAGHENVTILTGDWSQIAEHAPFDLLVLDGGGGGKSRRDTPADPSTLLKPGGTVVMDDYHPPADGWPPAEMGGLDNTNRDLDRSREYWFNHPDLLTTEFRIHPQVSTVVGMRKGTD